MKQHNGLFVVTEGPDGSGKETQTGLLCARLENEGHRVHRFDFPTYGKSAIADLIRELLTVKQETWQALPWQAKAMLFAANREEFRDHLSNLLADPRAIVVSNRYVASNQAHMAAYVPDTFEHVQRFAWIEALEYGMTRLPKPDIVFLYALPCAVARRFLTTRESGVLDAHEKDVPYQDRVLMCFETLARREQGAWREISVHVDGNVRSREDIHYSVWAALTSHPAWQTYVGERVQA